MNLKGLARRSLTVGCIGCVVVVLGFFAFLAVGTSIEARYQDVSREAEHARWVGLQCVVLKGLFGYGATAINGNHVLRITLPPGVGGRHVTFNTDVPKGTILTVASVRRCWNCPFDRISYGFKIDSIPRLATAEVFGGPQVLAPEELSCARPK